MSTQIRPVSFGAKFSSKEIQSLVAEAKAKNTLPELAAMLKQAGNMPGKKAHLHYSSGNPSPGSFSPNSYSVGTERVNWYSYDGFLKALKHLTVKSTEDTRPIAKKNATICNVRE